MAAPLARALPHPRPSSTSSAAPRGLPYHLACPKSQRLSLELPIKATSGHLLLDQATYPALAPHPIAAPASCYLTPATYFLSAATYYLPRCVTSPPPCRCPSCANLVDKTMLTHSFHRHHTNCIEKPEPFSPPSSDSERPLVCEKTTCASPKP